MGISSPKNISLFEILMSYGLLKGAWSFTLYSQFISSLVVDVKLANIKVGQLIKFVWKTSSGFNSLTNYICKCNIYKHVHVLQYPWIILRSTSWEF